MSTQTELARRYKRGLQSGMEMYTNLPAPLTDLARTITSPIYVRAYALSMEEHLRDAAATGFIPSASDSPDLTKRQLYTRLLKALAGAGYLEYCGDVYQITPSGAGLVSAASGDSPMATIRLNPYIPGLDGPTFEQEYEPVSLNADEVALHINCANCGDIYLERFPAYLHAELGTAQLYRMVFNTHVADRLCGFCKAELTIGWTEDDHSAARAEIDAWEHDLKHPALLTAPQSLEVMGNDLYLIVATNEDHANHVANVRRDIETLARTVEQQQSIIRWWQTHFNAITERLDAIQSQLSSPAPDRLSMAHVEQIGDMAYEHTGHRLKTLLEYLNLPGDVDAFRAQYPTLDDATAIIGKRVIDEHLPVMVYAARSRRARNGSYYLELHFGFGTVAVFDEDIKRLFADYPHDIPYTDPDYDATLEPPVEITLERDARHYPRISKLRIVS